MIHQHLQFHSSPNESQSSIQNELRNLYGQIYTIYIQSVVFGE